MTDETIQGEVPADAAVPAESAPAPEAAQPAPIADDAGEPERKHWANERIDTLTRNWREEQRRNAELMALLSQRGPEKAPEPEKARTPPRLEDFGYDEDKYQSAVFEHANAQAMQAVETRFAQFERERSEQARREAFQARSREFAKSTPDFEDKVLADPTLRMSQVMIDVIADSPNGPEMAYYLAAHRETVDQFMRLPPHLAALEMGRLESRLLAEKAPPPKPAPVTQAPPPPPKVEVTDAAPEKVSTTDPASDTMSTDEWVRAERKRMARKAKANG